MRPMVEWQFVADMFGKRQCAGGMQRKREGKVEGEANGKAKGNAWQGCKDSTKWNEKRVTNTNHFRFI